MHEAIGIWKVGLDDQSRVAYPLSSSLITDLACST